MLKTILLLIVTLVLVPLVSFQFDEPLSEMQWHLLRNCLFIALGAALTCFATSEITRNCSQVDKIWSLLPIVYVWYITAETGCSERMVLMACLVTVWGARLTFNFARRGAYSIRFWSGEEDYRWGVLRKNPALNTPIRWMLFNLFFISLYQNGLILLFCLPILMAAAMPDLPLYGADYILAAAFLLFVIIETIADQQQWNFQKEKWRQIKAGEKTRGEYAQGFVSSGLWKWVRHPNFMAEQAIWICFYLFSVAVTGRWFNWSVAGSLLLLLLFQGSSDFSEGISASKYPAYADYQKRTGRFFPKLFGKRN